jgi:hypothetical protein
VPDAVGDAEPLAVLALIKALPMVEDGELNAIVGGGDADYGGGYGSVLGDVRQSLPGSLAQRIGHGL